jgi:hypothetical protein
MDLLSDATAVAPRRFVSGEQDDEPTNDNNDPAGTGRRQPQGEGRTMTRGRILWACAAFWAALGMCEVAYADTHPSCVNLPNVVCATGADTVAGPLTFDGTSPIVLEGATADSFQTTLSVTDPTAARTLTIPNADSATATAISCAGGNHVSAFNVTTGVFTCTADSGGSSHTLLDGSVHTDTVAQTVSRGSLVYGNATPAWDELTIGGAGTFLHSDGTDAAWAAISSSDIGAGDLANALTWNEVCTASPCTLANAPRTSDTALIVHHTLTLRRVATCGGVGEYTLSGTSVTFCGEAPSTGVDSAMVTYER